MRYVVKSAMSLEQCIKGVREASLLFTDQSGIRHYNFGKWFSKRSICIRRYFGWAV